MKKVTLSICIFFFTFCSLHPLIGQKLFKEKHYYIQNEEGEIHKISKTEAKTLLEKYPESKKLYRDMKKMNIVTAGSFIVAVPLISYYFIEREAIRGVNNFFGSNGFYFTKGPNIKPLFIGSTMTLAGIVSAIYGRAKLQKAISVYNDKAGYKKPENHALIFSASPGNLALSYQF